MILQRLIILITIITHSVTLSNGQQMLGYVEVSGVVKDGFRPLPNTNIEIYANKTLLKIEAVDITGNFDFILELNREYQIKFTREFYAPKILQFNTNVRENELGIWFLEFTVELFPDIEGIDFSFLEEEPVGKISYNQQYGEFEHNPKYTKMMHEKIESLFDSYNSKRNNAYEKTVKKADAYLKANKQIQAINLYRKAAVLDRANEYPQEQVFKIDKELKKQMPGYERYIGLLQNADSLFQHHKFRQARFHYNLALDIIDESSYAQYKVDKINSLLPKFDPSYLRLQKYRTFLTKADQFVSEIKYEKAIKYYNKALSIQPGDTYALKQIRFLKTQLSRKQGKQEKQKKYREYINLGDRYFENSSLSAARLTYLKALQIEPNEKYPQVQIEKIDRILYPEKARQTEKDFPGFTEIERNESFLNELAKKYPNGKTVEYYDLPGKKIKRVIIVEKRLATEYLEVRYNYGTFFFRNGQNISRAIFISETKY